MDRHDDTAVETAIQRYHSELDAIDVECDRLTGQDRLFAKIRAGLFFISMLFFVVGYGFDGVPGAGWIGWIVLFLFVVAVVANEPIRDRLEEKHKHRNVIGRLIARLKRDWDHLATKRLTKQLAEVNLPKQQSDVAGDLDLLGNASLFHLVSMAVTAPGIRTLAHWLAGPAEATVATERAEAAKTLAPKRDQRLRFYTLARQVAESSGDPDRFVGWATGPAWLAERRWMVGWARVSTILAALLIGGLVLGSLGFISVDWFRSCLVGLGTLTAINLLITTVFLGPAHAIFAIAMSNRRAVSDYQEIFAAASWLPDSQAPDLHAGGFLHRIRRTMVDGQRSAASGMRDLQRVARAGGLRQSAASFFVYLPLQCLTLWDVKVLDKLEHWQADYADDVADWFDCLGQLESLMSIAALWDEYPKWAEPHWHDSIDGAVFQATAIGHPLLHDDVRVCNDVSVGPAGTLLLVTGSNMSGKSTLLRSIGLNAALAGIGGPVCADRLALPSLELATSIRVSDDVSQGVSFYMAELKRLKSVVDHAHHMATTDDRVCLFLLDEILQGTNSRERQIAVVKVLRHLMHSGAIGAISTHDLELADDAELQAVATTVHFRETICPDAEGHDQMTFDYQIRDGVSPTTNALRLLEMVGLGED
jgi:predicted ATPase